MEFEYKGISYYLEKLQDETDNVFYERCWFIIKQQPNSIEEFNNLIIKSEVWSNHKFLNCKYHENIQKELDHVNENILYNK